MERRVGWLACTCHSKSSSQHRRDTQPAGAKHSLQRLTHRCLCLFRKRLWQDEQSVGSAHTHGAKSRNGGGQGGQGSARGGANEDGHAAGRMGAGAGGVRVWMMQQILQWQQVKAQKEQQQPRTAEGTVDSGGPRTVCPPTQAPIQTHLKQAMIKPKVAARLRGPSRSAM